MCRALRSVYKNNTQSLHTNVRNILRHTHARGICGLPNDVFFFFCTSRVIHPRVWIRLIRCIKKNVIKKKINTSSDVYLFIFFHSFSIRTIAVVRSCVGESRLPKCPRRRQKKKKTTAAVLRSWTVWNGYARAHDKNKMEDAMDNNRTGPLLIRQSAQGLQWEIQLLSRRRSLILIDWLIIYPPAAELTGSSLYTHTRARISDFTRIRLSESLLERTKAKKKVKRAGFFLLFCFRVIIGVFP